MFGNFIDDLYDIGKSINKIFDVDTDYIYSKWPVTNVYSNEDEYIVVSKIPGMNKEDISLVIKDNTLKISGVRKSDGSNNYHLNERYTGEFSKSILLNEKVDAEKIDAQLNNGILIVKLPKSPDIKPKNIAIK